MLLTVFSIRVSLLSSKIHSGDDTPKDGSFMAVFRRCFWYIKNVQVQYAYTTVGPKVSGLTYKSRAKWKMLRGIYSAVYGEANVSVKGDCIEK